MIDLCLCHFIWHRCWCMLIDLSYPHQRRIPISWGGFWRPRSIMMNTCHVVAVVRYPESPAKHCNMQQLFLPNFLCRGEGLWTIQEWRPCRNLHQGDTEKQDTIWILYDIYVWYLCISMLLCKNVVHLSIHVYYTYILTTYRFEQLRYLCDMYINMIFPCSSLLCMCKTIIRASPICLQPWQYICCYSLQHSNLVLETSAETNSTSSGATKFSTRFPQKSHMPHWIRCSKAKHH